MGNYLLIFNTTLFNGTLMISYIELTLFYGRVLFVAKGVH